MSVFVCQCVCQHVCDEMAGLNNTVFTGSYYPFENERVVVGIEEYCGGLSITPLPGNMVFIVHVAKFASGEWT